MRYHSTSYDPSSGLSLYWDILETRKGVSAVEIHSQTEVIASDRFELENIIRESSRNIFLAIELVD